ncbi:hypothetical protein O181_119925 [Austropuccinia psidii MF-1]|uniref:Uncharacterized protein n=1 Tax=Austropuccinia psidii MF-1 TaxID=1389203 RepID=A0A9Q3KJ81_9BASI|nr:hypothetical protein [Austropuccinia psidii MF-1]
MLIGLLPPKYLLRCFLGAEIEVITKEQFLNNSSQIDPRLERMSKDAGIPQYVQEKLQEARELLVADIDYRNFFKKEVQTFKESSKKENHQTFQLASEVNEGESGALCPSANESNNEHPINATNDHPVGIPGIGGVTNHHENIVQSSNLDTQEAATIPNENISTETQRTVTEYKIVFTHQWIQLLVH